MPKAPSMTAITAAVSTGVRRQNGVSGDSQATGGMVTGGGVLRSTFTDSVGIAWVSIGATPARASALRLGMAATPKLPETPAPAYAGSPAASPSALSSL